MCETTFIVYIFAVSGGAAWLLTLARKWGIIEYVQVHGCELLRKMFSCDFCLSWWTAWLIVMPIFFFTLDCSVFLLPFITTCITRHLL